MFAVVVILWVIAALCSVVTNNLILLFCASLCLALGSILMFSDMSRAIERMLGLLGPDYAKDLKGSRVSALSLHGHKLLSLVEAIGYRINNLFWEAQVAQNSGEKMPQKLLPEQVQDSKSDSFEDFLIDLVVKKFRAKACALGFFQDAGKSARIFSHGVSGKRFDTAFAQLMMPYARYGAPQNFGLCECSSANSASANLSDFGFKNFVMFPLSESAPEGVLWLGYTQEHPPLEGEVRFAKAFALKLGEELVARRKLTELSSRIAEAESSDKQKSEFLAQMSHDIRSPLNNIKAILNLIKLEGIGPDTHEMLAVALNNCENMGELVEDILDYSRHQAGKLSSNPKLFDLVQCVAGVAEAFAVMARLKGLRLEFVGALSGAYVLADERQIKRVVSNIVSNAIKYTRHGSVVVTVSKANSGSNWEISVRDTGIGMSDEQLKRLFTPFTTFQREAGLDKNDSNRIEGVGLGLALSRILVRLNKGEIVVHSVQGKGSSFEIAVPAAAHHQIDQLKSAQIAPVHAETRAPFDSAILILDDDPDCVETLARNLERRGYKTLKAYTIDDAIGIFNFEEPGIVISDGSMPNGGVRRFLHYVNESAIATSLAVLSGNVGAAERENYLSLGASNVFTKPADMEALFGWIEHEIWAQQQAKAKKGSLVA